MNWIYGLLALVVICLLVAGGWWFTTHSAQHVAVKEQTTAGTAVVGEKQAQSNAAAQTIVVKGDQRAHLDIQVHQQNAAALEAAPGGSEKLDPAFVATFNRGLCNYASDASDPGCPGLHAGNTAVVPPADSKCWPAGSGSHAGGFSCP